MTKTPIQQRFCDICGWQPLINFRRVYRSKYQKAHSDRCKRCEKNHGEIITRERPRVINCEPVEIDGKVFKRITLAPAALGGGEKYFGGRSAT